MRLGRAFGSLSADGVAQLYTADADWTKSDHRWTGHPVASAPDAVHDRRTGTFFRDVTRGQMVRPGCVSSRGTSLAQTSRAIQQRVRNRQPNGGPDGLGRLPRPSLDDVGPSCLGSTSSGRFEWIRSLRFRTGQVRVFPRLNAIAGDYTYLPASVDKPLLSTVSRRVPVSLRDFAESPR